MSRMRLSLAALPALLAFTACTPAPPPPPAQVIVQTTTTPVPIIAPGPPPAAQVELVPPPPQGSGPVVWQPGHWQFSSANGGSWAWAAGHYLSAPPGETAWVP